MARVAEAEADAETGLLSTLVLLAKLTASLSSSAITVESIRLVTAVLFLRVEEVGLELEPDPERLLRDFDPPVGSFEMEAVGLVERRPA